MTHYQDIDKFRHTITKTDLEKILEFKSGVYFHTNRAGKITKHFGYFVWNIGNGNRKIGDFAGNVGIDNRYRITINGKLYFASHLVRIMKNKPPKAKYVINCIDANQLNIRPNNLREITIAEKNENKGKRKTVSSVYKGVNLDKTKKKWIARFRFNGKRKYIGIFTKEKDACIAVYNFCKKHDLVHKLNFNQDLKITEDFAKAGRSSVQLKILIKRHLAKNNKEFKCCVSGETDEAKLRIHHLESYIIDHELNLDLFYDLDNVVILSYDLHVAYHRFAGPLFGKINFNRWKKSQ